MEEDKRKYYNDEWNEENKIFINGIEQTNIGTKEEPYYLPKLTQEQIKSLTIQFKGSYGIKHRKAI